MKIENTNLRSFFTENKEDFSFYLTNVRGIGEAKQHDYLNALEKKLIGIKSTNELKSHLSQAYTDPYARALKNLFNYMEYKEIEEFNGISIERWRKAIKLRRSGIREIYISDNELKEAYQSINEEVRPLFKVLVYSGARLTQAIAGMKRLKEGVTKGVIYWIPINSISKGKKKAYWLYLPSSFLNELKSCNGINGDMRKKIKYGRVSASTIRKWNLNFLIGNGIPESVADFIQGRASVTVGSSHYLAKTNQADLFYSTVIPKLLNILS